MNRISVEALRQRLVGDGEFALIDVREEGAFSRGHLLAASNLPLSRLELLIGDVVPRKSAEINLCDDGSGASERACQVLAHMGYVNLRILDGGVAVWALAGGAVFSGVNVPGKAFGEYIERTRGTPSISARALKDRLENGRPTVLLDCRTPEEHSIYCVPDAINCPGGELVYRALGADLGCDAAIVVHCAGRTRSIIGAQTLIDAGIGGAVMALENGTIAWELNGFDLEKGASRSLEPPSGFQCERARKAARRIAEATGVQLIDLDFLEIWRREVASRTLYVIDVRTREEYQAGHLPGASHVPGGQLVQNVERYLVTKGARVVLVDSDGVRALVTASWLRRMGCRNVAALSMKSGYDPTVCGVHSGDAVTRSIRRISASAIKELVESGRGIVVDLRRSVDYRRGHVPGAWFMTRADLARDIVNLPTCGRIILVSDDEPCAHLMACDLADFGRHATLMEGGLAAWSAAGGALETGLTRLASVPNDTHLDPDDFDDLATVTREKKRYLAWEIGLIHEIVGDPAAPYAVEQKTVTLRAAIDS